MDNGDGRGCVVEDGDGVTRFFNVHYHLRKGGNSWGGEAFCLGGDTPRGKDTLGPKVSLLLNVLSSCMAALL